MVAALLLLLIALLIFTQTAYFREKLKNRLITETERYISGELSIDNLNGNLYKNIEIDGIDLTQQDSLIAHFDGLKLTYRLLPLLKKEILIDSVFIDSPEIYLEQKSDSSWNFGNILKDSNQTSVKSKTKNTFRINIRLFSLRDGKLTIRSLSEMIPRKISQLNIRADADIRGDDITINLQRLNLEAVNPNIHINELSANYRMNEQGIRIDNFILRSGGSSIDGETGYRSLQNMEGIIQANKIDRNELRIVIPSLHLLCSPQIQTQFETRNDKLTAQVEMSHNNEKVTAKIEIDPFSNLFSGQGAVPYSTSLKFSNFSTENWIELANIQSILEGTVDLKGENLLDLNARLEARANLRNSSYNEVRFNALRIDGKWQDDNLTARLNARTDFGHVQADGKIADLLTREQFSVNLMTEQFNLSAFFPAIEKTILNGRINAKGSGFDLAKIRADADLVFSESRVYGYAVESLNSTLQFSKEGVKLDSIRLFVPGAKAAGRGNILIDSSRIDLQLQAHIDSLTVVDSIVQLPLQFDSINTAVRLQGPFSELQIAGDADIYNAKGYDAELYKASTAYKVNLKPDSINVMASLRADTVNYLGVRWDSMFVDFNYLNNEIELTGRLVEKDTLDLKTTAYISLGDTLSLSVPQLEMNTFLSDYYLGDTLTAFVFGTENIELNNFLLLERNNPEFRLSADGYISTSDTNSFHLLVEELDLAKFNRFIPVEDSVTGVLNTEVKLAGSSDDPIISGTYDLQKPGYSEFSVTALAGDFSYKNQEFEGKVRNPDLAESFSARFSAPFKLYLDSLQFAFSPPDSFNAQALLVDIQINKYLAEAMPNDSVSGILNMDLEAMGDFKQPQIFGKIRFDDVVYQNKKLGLDYSNAKALVHFNGNRMKLDTVSITQKEGMISLSGELEFDSTLISGNIISSTLQADANNFYVARNRNYELLIDANSFLKMGQSNPEFGGKIKVLRSDIYLPAIMTREMEEADENEPILVQALEEQHDTIALNSESMKRGKQTDKNKSSLFDDVTGRLNVEIPRNTWIRSNQMRLEFRGDVEIVKTGPYFELFGNLQIPRGHYVLYGRKLNIKDSELIFNGGEEFDPNLNFNAEYVFRGQDREKSYLELLVTGKLSDPQINFKLDDASITETDGMSVLIFGKTSDELGFSEQNGIVGSIGSNAVAGLITSQLSRTIGAQFNLDMIEVTATENWKSAAFVVGKYITNDIFVIYERGFGEEEGNEITPETITVEYELNDNLFLRLQSGNSITSGVDMILKFEQELEK